MDIAEFLGHFDGELMPTPCGMACLDWNNVPKEIFDPFMVLLEAESKKHVPH